MNTTKLTSDTLSEKPRLIRFGFLFFRMKPLTLAQIWEVGGILEQQEIKAVDGDVNVIAEMLERVDNIKAAQEIAVAMLFRSALSRWLFGSFVKSRLTMERYQQMMEYYLMTLRAAFFLISFTSLKGVKEITKKTNTPEATALGDSSEE